MGGCLGTRPADSPRWGLAWFWRENAGKRRAASSAAPAAVRGSRNGFPLHPPPGSAASLPASPPQRAHGALAARRPPLRTSPLPPPPLTPRPRSLPPLRTRRPEVAAPVFLQRGGVRVTVDPTGLVVGRGEGGFDRSKEPGLAAGPAGALGVCRAYRGLGKEVRAREGDPGAVPPAEGPLSWKCGAIRGQTSEGSAEGRGGVWNTQRGEASGRASAVSVAPRAACSQCRTDGHRGIPPHFPPDSCVLPHLDSGAST